LVQRTIRQQLEKIRGLIGSARFDSGNFDRAARLFEEMSVSENFPDFLTVPAYDFLD
jgi:malate synthase